MVVESHCLKCCRPFYDHSRLQYGWMTAVYFILIGGNVIRTILVHLQISLTMSPWIIEYIKNTTRLNNASFPFRKTYKALCKSTDVQKTLQHRQEEITKCVSCAESSGLNSLHAWCYMVICPTFFAFTEESTTHSGSGRRRAPSHFQVKLHVWIYALRNSITLTWWIWVHM